MVPELDICIPKNEYPYALGFSKLLVCEHIFVCAHMWMQEFVCDHVQKCVCGYAVSVCVKYVRVRVTSLEQLSVAEFSGE